MFEMTMAASGPHLDPPAVLDQLDNFSNLHRHIDNMEA
jgi:hypothetical protein